MKLIDEKAVDERLKGSLAKYDIGFRCGVDFAEQKLLPLMVDYALWWKENVRKAEIPYHYCIKGQWTMCYKKEQVLEKFLKSKQ